MFRNNHIYFKNFDKHRKLILLNPKVDFSKNFNNDKKSILENFNSYNEFFKNNLNFKKFIKEKESIFIFNQKIEQKKFDIINPANKHELNKFFTLAEKKNHFPIINFLSNLFRYSYLYRFMLDSITIFCFIFFIFNTVTFF